ncbi:MAG: DUF2147 domain-containing protein [Granulosicoccaceae bacterium]
MRFKIIFSSLLFITASLPAQAADVDGLWASPPKEETKGHIEVEIAPCAHDSAKRCGVIKQYYKDGKVAESDIVGKDIIKDMKSAGTKAWKGGTIWAPDDDKTYSSKMELLDDNTLKVSGCVLRFLCRAQEWTRVQ